MDTHKLSDHTAKWKKLKIREIDPSEFELNKKLSKKDSLSKFDEYLQKAWKEQMDKGYFRYNFESVEADYKIIEKSNSCEKSLPYLAHINEARYIRYEKPKKIPFKKIDEEFNIEKFSFLGIDNREIICKLSSESTSRRLTSDLVVINSAPLEFGHILLIPEIENQQRQSLTLEALYSALNLLRLSGSSNFKLMFNSLQGGASVNHLHIHGMYSKYEKHSDNLSRKRLHENCSKNIFITTDSVNQGYVITNLTEDEDTCNSKLEDIHRIVKFFEKKQIAYNMTMFYNSESLEPEAVIWPRKSLVELNSNPFEIAVSEISGHLIYKSRSDFDNANLESIENHLESAVLEESEYGEIDEWINKNLG